MWQGVCHRLVGFYKRGSLLGKGWETLPHLNYANDAGGGAGLQLLFQQHLTFPAFCCHLAPTCLARMICHPVICPNHMDSRAEAESA